MCVLNPAAEKSPVFHPPGDLPTGPTSGCPDSECRSRRGSGPNFLFQPFLDWSDILPGNLHLYDLLCLLKQKYGFLMFHLFSFPVDSALSHSLSMVGHNSKKIILGSNVNHRDFLT